MSKLHYRIDLENSCFDRVASLAKERKVFCLTDTNTHEACLPILQSALSDLSFHSINIAPGEKQKNLETCHEVWNELLENEAERDSLFLALGGGVVTDLGGFVAATYRRGMPFVPVPTTLLGMVDAAIGGKNGVDLEGYKNMIGTIRQPDHVPVHPPFLRSLNDRQKRSGYAEILKHSLLEGPDLFQRTRGLDLTDEEGLESLLPDAIEVKREIVEEDPHEKGMRESLNFGHTVGHAIETLSMKHAEPLLHGEAVAAGMLVEALISHQEVAFPKSELERLIQDVLSRFGKIELGDHDEIIRTMEKDKKNRDGKIRMVLLERVGKPLPASPIEPEDIGKALEAYQHLK